MFRKLLLPAICLVAPTALLAAHHASTKPLRSVAQNEKFWGIDVYGGLSLSHQMGAWEADVTSENLNDKKRGLLTGRYGMLLGLEKTLPNHLSIGLEASFQSPFDTLAYERRSSTVAERDRHYEGTHYALALLPGYRLEHGLLFAAISRDWQKFKSDHKGSTDTGDFSQVEPGHGLGFGLESAISNRFGVRLSHEVSHYKTVWTSEGGALNAATYSPTDDTTSLSLVYHLQDTMNRNGQQQPRLADGFYAGLMLGRDNLYFYEHEIVPDGSYRKQTQAAGGVLRGGKLGYTHTWFNRFNAGLEASYDTSSVAYRYADTLTSSDNYAIDKDKDYKISVMPGYLLQDSNLVFARLGMAYSKFTHENNHGNNIGGNTYRDKTRHGPLFGLGVKMALTDHVNISMEDNYIVYVHDIKSQPSGADITANTSSWHRKFRANQFIVSANYVF